MRETIVPLRQKRDQIPALVGFDALAMELLIEGRAPNLSVARLDAILGKLRGQRTELAAILADLEGRVPSCDARIEAINADLRDGAREGLAQINLFIHESECCRSKAEQSRSAI